MVGSSLVTERVEESGSVDLLTREDKSVRISREPSFSGWFDEDGIPLPARLRNDEVNEEDFVFRLHLVQPQGSENGVLDREGSSNFRHRMEHGGDTDGASTNGLRKQNESYVPLDIENSHDIDKTYTSSTSSYNRVDYNSPFRRNEENPISVSDVLKTLVLILVWYTFSTFLTLYNKTLLGDDMGKFPAPLLMNTIHFAMQAVLSMGITWFWSDRFHSSVMSWKDYFVRVVPTALSTALDVNLSNASLVFISVTFATMCKSAAPIFLLLFAFAFRLESPSVKLLGIILVISVGILLTVAKETEFEFWGFLFVMLAAVMSGFRWTMTQILLQVLTEYILVSVTSAVTVTIAGVVKEAVTILVAVFYFHDKFTWMKGVGLLTIMVGVSLFNWYKYQKLHNDETTAGSPTDGPASKYVILDELDEEEDEPDTATMHLN
ncbi:UNVERIFIED_CONTAM: putative sugar phosphate/phosphate translocator [Sesamum angustifolium]|uniref:Sugar phosphate/phosphate translocator n=1 Tax=Sesamum angustifolium TaxID=2727405 RepID=A0AAW2PDM3_9LAMI